MDSDASATHSGDSPSGPPLEADVPPQATVIRFRPTEPERVLASASKEYRRLAAEGRAPRYLLSVFAAVPMESEDEPAVIDRLVDAAGLSHIQLDGHRKVFICSRASQLYQAQFKFYKDGDEDELEEHYSVDLGEEPTLDDVRRFLEQFDRTEPLRR